MHYPADLFGIEVLIHLTSGDVIIGSSYDPDWAYDPDQPDSKWVRFQAHTATAVTYLAADHIQSIITDPGIVGRAKRDELTAMRIHELHHRSKVAAIPDLERQVGEAEKQAAIPPAERNTGPMMMGGAPIMFSFGADPTEDTGTGEAIDDWLRSSNPDQDADEGTDV